MPVILTCSCNTKLRVPDNLQGKRVRCPRCQAELVSEPTDTGIIVTDQEPTRGGGSCPICQTNIAEGEISLACPECKQVHHRECWAEVGGCSTYGCPKAPAPLEKPATADDVPRTAWGDTKKCPLCAETIKSIALKCRFCGADFDTVDPLTVKDLHSKHNRQDTLQGVQRNVWTLFFLSLIGCLAPLVLVINGIWFFNKRKLIAKAGPFYSVVSYASLTINVVFCVLIVIFMVAS